MKIAVIGAGNVGTTLAERFSRAGHEVTISASSPESAEAKARHLGVAAAATNREAAEAADVIVLAVWYAQEEAVATEIADVAAGKVVVEVSNPLTPEMGLATEGGPSAAEQLADRLPGAKVVKAFNTVFGQVQANPTLHGVAADNFLAGDDADAKRTVAELVETIGLRPVDAGPLRNARLVEALAFLAIGLNAQNGWAWNTAWKLVGAPIPEPQAPRELVGAGAAR
jgi:NADPH-dependent F420 reductase